MPESRQGQRQRSPARRLLRGALALFLLSLVAAGCFSLGLWQLGRAAERDTLHQTIERGRLQAPLLLAANTPSAELIPWRSATSQGRWSTEHTVLLQNRNLEGRPGYWVATPLLLTPVAPPFNRHDSVSAGSAELGAVAGDARATDFLGRGAGAADAAVLVLRGWLPRDMEAGGAAPAIPQEPGLLQVSGELHSHVPRIFELWDWAGGASSQLPHTVPDPSGAIAQVQNLDLDEYARATGLDLLPVVLAQTSASALISAAGTEGHTAPAAGTGKQAPTVQELRREWPGPSLDSDQNRGYALQWFGFSAIAVIAALYVARGMLRRSRPERSSKEAR